MYVAVCTCVLECVRMYVGVRVCNLEYMDMCLYKYMYISNMYLRIIIVFITNVEGRRAVQSLISVSEYRFRLRSNNSHDRDSISDSVGSVDEFPVTWVDLLLLVPAFLGGDGGVPVLPKSGS